MLAMVAAGIQEGVSKLRAVSALEQLGSEIGWEVHPYPKKTFTIQPSMLVVWIPHHESKRRPLPTLPTVLKSGKPMFAM